MIKILFAILFSVNIVWPACTKINMPTDYSIVANATRANLKANFDEVQTKTNPCMDSVDEVRGRFSGYAGSFGIYSLDNLRLRLDTDASTTARFSVENSNGDSLFRVSEDSSAKAFGALAVAGRTTLSDSLIAISARWTGNIAAVNGTLSGTFNVTGVATLTAAPVLSALTASLPVFTNGSKALTSNAMTGTGSVVMSASPTLTGTITAADATLSGNLTISALTASLPVFTNGSKALASNAMTGTGNVVMSASPTLTGTLTAATGAFSGNVNIGGAVNVAGYGVNVLGSGMAITGGNSYNAFGVGTPDVSNYEYIGMSHSGTLGTLTVSKGGTGTFRDFVLKTSDTERYRVSSTGSHTITGAATISSTLGVTGITTATGGLTLGASFVDKTTTLTSNTTLTSAHSTILADATGGAFTITLPTAAGNTGLTYKIIKIDASTNLLTITTTGAQTIGAFSNIYPLAGNIRASYLEVMSNGTNWSVITAYDAGTFTYTEATGVASTPTGSANWEIGGQLNVTIYFTPVAGTGNSTAFTVTGIPSGIIPGSNCVSPIVLTDNSAMISGLASLTAGSGTITLSTTVASGTPVTYNASGFTASGTKQLGNGTSRASITYQLVAL